MVQRDVFPTTHRSWIGQKLLEGTLARGEINHHIMAVYAHPLQVYFSGCRDRWLGEPQDIVAGFFADRLSREDFLIDWEKSSLRLRRWLMNAFCFYLSELKRKRKRDNQAELTDPEDRELSSTSEVLMDRAFVESIIRESLKQTQQQCINQGLGDHWGIFVRHHYEGQSYDSIAQKFEVTSARAAVMSRTAARRFRMVLRNLLCSDGTAENEIDQEIRFLLEISSS